MTALLDETVVRLHLHSMWTDLQIIDETASTNDDVLAAAAAGAPEGTVLVAEFQTAGRGRLKRSWESPVGTALMFSMLLRPRAPMETWGWVPIVAGLGVYDALREAGADVVLKWPNDIQLGTAREKCGGILTQARADAVVVGIGLNVVPHDALPEGAAAIGSQWAAPREDVLTAVLAAIAVRYRQWNEAAGDVAKSGMLDDYRNACATIGQRVRVSLPGREDAVEGVGEDIDPDGRLVVRTETGLLVVGAGDVVHVRPVD